MKSDEQIADEVLLRTLVEVRSARARRKRIKAVLSATAILTAGILLFPKPAPVSNLSVPVVTAEGGPLPASRETLAVMVWRDGGPRLEMMEAGELGSMELQFSLDPVFAFTDDGL